MKKLTIGLVIMATGAAMAADVEVDFTQKAYPIRPALHSAGWGPRSSSRYIDNDDAKVKAMNLLYARTHDWALVNPGQRVVDYQYIFPLFDKDPSDPSNYYFGPTDHLLELSRNLGLKIFYRLGTSIEHTDGAHFNAAMPKDFDKTAEIFAGIIRHYNKGWANGKHWDINYWEIWNEPEGCRNMWCMPVTEGDGSKDREFLKKKFIEFYVTVLKRLKREFPELMIGGPALQYYRPEWIRDILVACKEAGVAPDFISWHYYGNDVYFLTTTATQARMLCDELGFKKTELIINEWHYLLSWEGVHGRNSSPAMVKRAMEGPTGLNNIDSATFALASLIWAQGSWLNMANYYGCAHKGNWGYMDEYKQPNKVWYALKTFGEIVRDYKDICVAKSKNPTVHAMPVVSADGKRKALLLVDYTGSTQVIKVEVKGVPADARISATLLDYTHDNFPVEVQRKGDTLTFVKPDKNSAAFFVEFD